MRVVVTNRKGKVIAEKNLPFKPYRPDDVVKREEREERYKRAMGVL